MDLPQAIVETDRKVEEEPDLDRRAAILEEALQRYPGEPHFERALQAVRDKRELVNSIVAQARFFEEHGQIHDALDQWQILKSIHERQPGLAAEIQRLGQKQTAASQDDRIQALSFLVRAQELNENGSTEEALAVLREACRLDPRNAVIRGVLADSLAAKARRVVQTDAAAAQAVAREVVALDPNYSIERIFTPPPRHTPIEPEPTPAEPGAPLPLPQPQASTPVRPPPPTPKKLLFGTAAAAAFLVMLALFTSHHSKKTPPPTPVASKYSITFHSTAGAEIRINGDSCGLSSCRLDLAPGSYRAEAHLTGYQDAVSNLTVGPGIATDVNLALAPLPPRISIVTDLSEGAVSLDDTAAGQIQSGGAEIANVSPGKHILAVRSGDSAAAIPIEIAPGAAPVLSGAIDTKNLRCFLVAGYGSDARVYGTAGGYRVTLDGKPLGNLDPAGMPLTGLAAGTHELALDSDSGQHDKIAFESQPSATLYVSLGGSQSLGVLFVETNLDEAQLYIDGQRYKRDTARGRLVVYLAPKKYSVVVQKDGYTPALAQTVDIKRGVETKVSFNLTAGRAILAVHHTPPATDVLVDGIKVGATHADGEFQVGGIDPGHHTVSLRNDKFKPLDVEQNFVSAKTVDIQAALEPTVTAGTLRFDISPALPEVHIRIQRDGEAQEHEVMGPAVSLPQGHYTVSVSAPQYVTTTTAVQVSSGATTTATLSLRRSETPKAPAKTAPAGLSFGLGDWLKTGGWTEQAGMLVRRGGDWVMAPPELTHATIHFTVVSLKGKHVEFVAGFRDERNYLLFELDDKNLTRYAVRGGSKSQQAKIPHQLDRKRPMGFNVKITPQAISVSVDRGIWIDIDHWELPADLTAGKFGFHIPGSDEIGLREFQLGAN